MTIRRTTEANDNLSDPVTGLAWPSAQHDHLELALLRARASGSHVGVVLIEINDLLGIRQRWGWGVGDAVLHGVAGRINAVLRDDDSVVRLNGDEFLIVCEDVTGDEDIDALVHRVARTLSRSLQVERHLFVLTISVAVATGSGSTSADALVADATSALAEARDAPVSPRV